MIGDRNNIFFNIVHYILSEQYNVNWILKTSFINFTGLSSEVSYSKFQKPSLVNEILEYLTEVKPFHTKFDQFIEKYTSKNDAVSVQGDRKTTAEGEIIIIPNLVEFFNLEERIRFDNITGEPDIEAYNNINSNQSLLDFFETNSANRIYATKTKDLDLIKEILKCGFKGLEINGGDFLIDAYGYDSLRYDSTLYDAPTITNSYCIVDYNEVGYQNYVKEFIGVGINLLKTNHPDVLNRSKTRIYSEYNNEVKEITDFNIINDTINIFNGIRLYERIVIIVSNPDNTTNTYIFVGLDFFEEQSDAGNKEFSQYGNIAFAIPSASYSLKSLDVYLENKNGSKQRITNWTRVENNIILDTIVDEFSRVNITVIDYEFIYDKIYTYEDVYASGNNLMILDGEGFLRPHWEKNHPSELTIGRGLTNAFVKKYNDNNELLETNFINYRHNNIYANFDGGETSFLIKELNMGDTEIYVNNPYGFQQPYTTSDGVMHPGVILIEDEIIEFYSVVGNVLAKIKRATNGSSFKNKYPINTLVYDFGDNNTTTTTMPCEYVGYPADTEKLYYKIPGDIKETSVINVYKKERVNMLNDLSPTASYIDFDKPVVVNPGQVLISYNPQDFFKVAKTDILGIQVGINKPLSIEFIKDITTLPELVKYISDYIPNAYNLQVSLINDQLVFNSTRGESLTIYNLSGYPVQAIFDGSILGTNENPTIIMDGVNGLSVNGRKIIWGTYKYTIEQLQKNPVQGDINDMILSINKNKTLAKDILARNNADHLEILSITGKDIILDNVGVDDSMTIIGLQSRLSIPTIVSYNNSYNSIVVEKKQTENPGYVEINNFKVYFYSYNEYVDNGQIKSRIENIITDQTLKKEDAIILTPLLKELTSPKDYSIDGQNILLNTTLKDYEVIYITNNY